MKAISYLSWAAGVVAAAMIVMGIISLISNARPFGVNHLINYFHAANTFLLVVICCLIYKRVGQAEGK